MTGNRDRGRDETTARIAADRREARKTDTAASDDADRDGNEDYISDSSFSWTYDDRSRRGNDEICDDEETVPVRTLTLAEDVPGEAGEEDNGFDPYDTGRLFATRS